jgi:tRNA(Ile2) C34 agmatinyltransferase TiaS
MKSAARSLCPVCNRYIGPVSKCPYCSSDAAKSPLILTIRISALLLATAGLFLLYLTAKHHDPPLITAAEITPAMNFAHIRISGNVRKKPYIARDHDYLSFRVYDESGSIQVVAYRKTAQKLISSNLLPAAGDSVTVRGNLSSSASKIKLYLKIPEHLMINPKTPTPTP